MFSPKVLITFKVPLISLILVVVHKVHVLDPSLSLNDKSEPDAGEYVHDDDQLKSHHENL